MVTPTNAITKGTSPSSKPIHSVVPTATGAHPTSIRPVARSGLFRRKILARIQQRTGMNKKLIIKPIIIISLFFTISSTFSISELKLIKNIIRARRRGTEGLKISPYAGPNIPPIIIDTIMRKEKICWYMFSSDEGQVDEIFELRKKY